MATSEQSVSDFIDKVQNGLNQLKTLEGTVDQAYGDFLSSEKASVSAFEQGALDGGEESKISPQQVQQALEGLFRNLVEVGFLGRLTDKQEQVQSAIHQAIPSSGVPGVPASLQFKEMKENLQGQAKDADLQCKRVREWYERMKSQISEQRKRAHQLQTDAKGLLEMRAQTEELESQAQQLRNSYEDACRSYEVVQKKNRSLETEKRKLEEELARQPLQPYIVQ